MRRFPSHGMRFGVPPKLQEQETAQLQLSATVAVICQSGAGACCEADLRQEGDAGRNHRDKGGCNCDAGWAEWTHVGPPPERLPLTRSSSGAMTIGGLQQVTDGYVGSLMSAGRADFRLRLDIVQMHDHQLKEDCHE